MAEPTADQPIPRRRFLRNAAGGAVGLAAVGVAASAGRKSANTHYVWQIDPSKCTQCGNCEINCVLKPSAVKCVQAYDLCGYCELCFGYSRPDAQQLDTAAENQLCPTGAIERKFIEEPYFEYNIDENLCIGCAICVRGCTVFGNGSFYLQVRHDLCVNCNECDIARSCPADAFVRVPAERPYLLKGEARDA